MAVSGESSFSFPLRVSALLLSRRRPVVASRAIETHDAEAVAFHESDYIPSSTADLWRSGRPRH